MSFSAQGIGCSSMREASAQLLALDATPRLAQDVTVDAELVAEFQPSSFAEMQAQRIRL